MRARAFAVLASIFLATSSLVCQEKTSQRTAITRVATPLREAPSVEASAFATIPPKTTVSVKSCADGWCTVEYQNRTGHAIQVFLRFAPAPPAQPLMSMSGRGYTNSQGQWVPSPTRTADGQPPAGASAKCRDNSFSFSRSRRGTCSHHGGVAQWL
jgi:hypothetical protein